MSGIDRGPRPDENINNAVDELAARTFEYENVLADAGDDEGAGSRAHVLLNGLRDLLSRESLRTIRG